MRFSFGDFLDQQDGLSPCWADSSTSSNLPSPEAALDSRMRMSGPAKAQEQKAGTVVRPAKKFCLLLLLLGLNLTLAVAQPTTLRQPDVPFVPTPQSIVGRCWS